MKQALMSLLFVTLTAVCVAKADDSAFSDSPVSCSTPDSVIVKTPKVNFDGSCTYDVPMLYVSGKRTFVYFSSEASYPSEQGFCAILGKQFVEAGGSIDIILRGGTVQVVKLSPQGKLDELITNGLASFIIHITCR